ncbi:MAG: oligosaccharide flippase family protein [Steroidobacteraceae bacterium]
MRRSIDFANLAARLRSPALRAAFFLMAGGAGFAVANVLLARVLSNQAFGVISLLLALNQVGQTLGPMGLDLTINRRRLTPTLTLLKTALGTAILVSTAIALSSLAFYGFSWQLMICLAFTASAAAVGRVAGAFLQSQQRFGYSLFLGQIHNYILLVAVPVIVLLQMPDSLLVALVIASGYLLTAMAGWWSVWPRSVAPAGPALRDLLKESMAGLGLVLAVQVLWQLERLIISPTLSIEQLGAFAVVTAIAGSPFRMMQIAIGYTLVPGLRACSSRGQMRRLLLREGGVVVVTTTAAIVAVSIATPLIVTRFLDNRYDISTVLLIAVIATGLMKIWQGFVSAIVQALGTTAALFKLALLSWIGVFAGAGFAIAGARFGLIGVVYGVGLGWLIVALGATGLAVRAARTSAPRSAS